MITSMSRYVHEIGLVAETAATRNDVGAAFLEVLARHGELEHVFETVDDALDVPPLAGSITG